MKAIRCGMLMALLVAGNAFAQSPTDCTKVSNPQKRLACFDNQQKAREQSAEEQKARTRHDEDEKVRKAAEEDQKRKSDDEQKKKTEFISAAHAPLSALNKLAAKVSVGVSYRDYYSPLADAKVEVDSFVKGANGTYNKEFSVHIIQALTHYEVAGSIWNMRFSDRGRAPDDMAITQGFLDLYPQASTRTRMSGNTRFIEYSTMLSIIWGEARNEISEAERALTTPTSNTPKVPSEPKDVSK